MINAGGQSDFVFLPIYQKVFVSDPQIIQKGLITGPDQKHTAVISTYHYDLSQTDRADNKAQQRKTSNSDSPSLCKL